MRGIVPLAGQYKSNFEMGSRKGTKDIEKTWNAQMKMRGKMKMVFGVVVLPLRARMQRNQISILFRL